jgi:hypothetical protein
MYVGSYCAPDGAIVSCQPMPTADQAYDLTLAAARRAYTPDDGGIPPLVREIWGDTLYGLDVSGAAVIQVEPGPITRLSAYDPSTGEGRIIDLR